MATSGKRLQAPLDLAVRRRLGQDLPAAGDHGVCRKDQGIFTHARFVGCQRLFHGEAKRMLLRRFAALRALIDGSRDNRIRNDARLRQQRRAARALAR